MEGGLSDVAEDAYSRIVMIALHLMIQLQGRRQTVARKKDSKLGETESSSSNCKRFTLP
jgi:hypothetical protein